MARLEPHGFGLALGGGGAKGYAHIGVLHEMHARGLRPAAIAGTSVGAMVGALLAAGYEPAEIERRFRAVPPDEAFRREHDAAPSFLGLAGLRRMLEDALGPQRTFADLPVPFAVTAVDLHTGRLVYLRRGPVVPAVLASAAVPGIFPPVPWGEGHLLVDGGVLDNVPVRLARRLAPGLPVVAVVLTPRPDQLTADSGVRFLADVPVFGKAIQRLRYVRALHYFMRSVDIAGAHLTHWRLAHDRPEVVIAPQVGDVGLLAGPEVADEVIARGRRAFEAAWPQMQRALQPWRRWWRAWRRPSNDDAEVLEL